ncbi:auxin-responsive protein SAUR71-like [Senna tora]|uniref:Auxin-responsive protein SAUR71-like n=1 Tax=Senna tora TaxID=362788 RepID=A0A834T3J8_9FABA|nr:auxin-responsive protein SAUR71-like [Senna tora]
MGARGSKLRKFLGACSSVYGHRRLERCVLGPKSYVPVCVGVNEENRRRFMVHIKALKDADFCELLRKSAEEYGFQNDGILRILFEAPDFEDWIIQRYNKNNKFTKVKSRRLYLLKQSNKNARRRIYVL